VQHRGSRPPLWLAQCRMTALGRAAQCITNPYFLRQSLPAAIPGPLGGGTRQRICAQVEALYPRDAACSKASRSERG
jgi:hypothetical protein